MKGQAVTRKGVWTDLMKPVVAKLTDEDFVSIAWIRPPVGLPARGRRLRTPGKLTLLVL